MTKTQLTKLKQESDTYLKRWVQNGGRTSSWICPHCEQLNHIHRPKRSDIAPGRKCWDSMTICVECGSLSFLLNYPSGKVEVHAGPQ